jgi:hypothetical protein
MSPSPRRSPRAAAVAGDVTIVINNAGNRRRGHHAPGRQFRLCGQAMEVNYFGTWAVSRAFAPILARNGGGALVNMLSVASWVGRPAADQVADVGVAVEQGPGHPGCADPRQSTHTRQNTGRSARLTREPTPPNDPEPPLSGFFRWLPGIFARQVTPAVRCGGLFGVSDVQFRERTVRIRESPGRDRKIVAGVGLSSPGVQSSDA